MSRTIIYSAMMVASIYLGKKGFLEKILKQKLSKIQSVLIFFLLFVLGVGIGQNKEVTSNLSAIGSKAIFMAIILIFSSVLAVKAYTTLRNKIFKKVKK